MKCAYFSFDRLALNTSKKLSENYSHIDYYLIKDEEPILRSCFEDLEIIVSHLSIPSELTLRTSAHAEMLQRLNMTLSSYSSNIYVTKIDNQVMQAESASSAHPVTMNTQLIDDVLFIKWDRNLSKYCVENKQRQLVEYDFLIIENNQFLMSSIIDKQENLFFSFTEQTQYFLDIEFEAEWKHKSIELNKSFILVSDHEINSIVDNWFLVKIQNNKVNCLIQLPMQGFRNEDFLEFIKSRVEVVLRRKIFILNKLKFKTLSSRPSDGFYKFKAQLRNSRFGALVPSYFLWTDAKRDYHLNTVMKSRGALKIGSDNKWKRGEL